MDAIPTYLSGYEVDPSGRYTCPLCRVQRAGDAEDTGWVRCPMLKGQMICLGSCIDHQKVARSDEFDSHYDRGLFETLHSNLRRPINELRSICMSHQIEVLDERIAEGGPNTKQMLELKALLLVRIRTLT
jgi:hypothetical protein